MNDEDFEKIIDELEDEIADLKAKLEFVVEELQAMLTIPNSGAAQGILKAYISSLIYSLTGGKDDSPDAQTSS